MPQEGVKKKSPKKQARFGVNRRLTQTERCFATSRSRILGWGSIFSCPSKSYAQSQLQSVVRPVEFSLGRSKTTLSLISFFFFSLCLLSGFGSFLSLGDDRRRKEEHVHRGAARAKASRQVATISRPTRWKGSPRSAIQGVGQMGR
ncbi:hypothetical protein BO94DRAFT_241654 [Aspergillus sclerotioniger CBS 115572]|uniref:Transmembrane protein n=1 Tax=Aspergillus sclerotioniger CBS 115572 TaxID=1450535 RepID=A0A317VI70_9EURO|nr:hypothetical protein BO94DRAFT_241654 [Aspergillus sclerotioniger CBS 115572]PWY73159.1 hypothetical protein BO94DRAFT_241654 [Aspergillus sclerotioniger CBS 115572]